MTLHLPPILVLVLVQWVGADPEREIGAWAALYGVPVAVALAVAETETGNVPEGGDGGQGYQVRMELPDFVARGRDFQAGRVLDRLLGLARHREASRNRSLRAVAAGFLGLVGRGGELGRVGVDFVADQVPRGQTVAQGVTRDTVISSGNVGRMQINATTWCPVLGLPRSECVEALQDRSNNIRVGTAVLARVQAKYAPGPGLARVAGCRCGRPHAGGWVAHYNGGTLVNAGTRPERYGLRVLSKVRRMTAGGTRGW